MMDQEGEPRVRVEAKTPRQELQERREKSTMQRREDAVMATYKDQVRAWMDFSSERTGKVERNTRVALIEAPAAPGYDPDALPSEVRRCLGPAPTSGVHQRLGPKISPHDKFIVEGSASEDEPQRTSGDQEGGKQLDGKAPPRHGRVVRQQEREQKANLMRDGVAAATLERRNRRTLKRYFTAVTSERTALYPKTFMGPMICHHCGRKSHGTDICWVTLWKQGGALPRNKTMPCLYCKSRQHTVDACCYLHHRCSRGCLLGHVQAECGDRSPEIWKQMFLDCAEYGVLTGRNPYGPIRGQFGLGAEPRDPASEGLVFEVRNKIEQRAAAEGWPMEKDVGFSDAVEAKRREAAPFDLWWRGVVTKDDIDRMRERLQGGKTEVRAPSRRSGQEAPKARKRKVAGSRPGRGRAKSCRK